MKHPPVSLRKILVQMAIDAGNDKGIFWRLMRGNYREIGSGASRRVFAADEWVIKIRRHRPQLLSAFTQEDINDSNKEEFYGYHWLRNHWYYLSHFVLRPYYVKLPNEHDAIIMRQVEYTCQQMKDKFGKNWVKTWAFKNPLLYRMRRFLVKCFYDAHNSNLGVLDGRLYLIDCNIYGILNNAKYDKIGTENNARILLKEAGVKTKPSQVT